MAIREVTFKWDDSKGDCYDCGNPAARISSAALRSGASTDPSYG